MKNLVKKSILGVGVTNASSEEILEYVAQQVKENKEKFFIVTPNPEMVVYANDHHVYREVINQAQIALCDGVGLFIASSFLGKRVKERISGVGFMISLCEKAAKNGLSIGLLGGRGGVAERTAKCLQRENPDLKISYVAEEFDQKDLSSRGVDILFVAYGVPKQEEWIMTHLAKLPVKVAMGVGGAFDYLSGDIMRAPFFIRSIGLEWLFRLIRQPWRIKRQLALLVFIKLVTRELVFKRR